MRVLCAIAAQLHTFPTLTWTLDPVLTQDHYDYGLRSFVIPIARAAGSLKRVEPDASEEVILYRWGGAGWKRAVSRS